MQSAIDIGKFDLGQHPKYINNMKDRTLLIACKVVNGKIVDQGNHDLLISRPGRYRDLCERQLIRGA